jgi:hypothetical protein
MTTFDQALANLQQNSNKLASEVKGYNVDIAKFQSQRANDTARIFELAGEMGKDISKRLAERKAKEEKYDDLESKFQSKYLGNYKIDPEFTGQIFQSEFGQVQASTMLADSVNKGKLSSYVGTEGINQTGIGDRAITATLVQGKSLEFTHWYYNQIRTNKGSFTAYIVDPATNQVTSQILNINASNLNREQNNARLQYLTKQFIGQSVGQYSDEFLIYDQKDGGSGFAQSLMTQVDKLKVEAEKGFTSQSGINNRNRAADILFKTDEMNAATLQTAVSLVLNSSNLEGTGIMRRDKAWKAFHDILTEGAKTGNITREKLTEIVNLEIFDINGNKTLAQHRPDLYGDSKDIKGTVFKEVDDYKKNLNTSVDERNEAIQLEKKEGWKKEIADGLRTWDDQEIQKEIAEWMRDDPELDSFEINNELKSVPTEASTATATEILNRYEKKEIGERKFLTDYLEGHPLELAIRNDPRIKKQLQVEEGIEKLLEEELGELEVSASKTTRKMAAEGGASWPDATSGAEYWKWVKAEAVQRYLDSEKRGLGKTYGDIILELKAEIAAVPEIELPYNEILIKRGLKIDDNGKLVRDLTTDTNGKSVWDKRDKAWIKEWDKKVGWNVYDTSYHAHDSNGLYVNVYKNSKLLNPNWYSNSQKNKEEENLPNLNLKDPVTKFPGEENWIKKYPAKNGEAVDWNEYVENEGITSDVYEVCKAQKKSPLKCIQERAEASGQTLSEDVIEKLSDDILKNVDPKTKKKIENGEGLNNKNNMDISNSSNDAGVLNNLNGGEEGQKITDAMAKWWCDDCIDPTGKWKAGLENYGKFNLGLGMGFVKSLSDTADRDFTLDGAEKFFEATKDIPKEDLLASVYNNPTAAFEAAKHSGDVSYLPKEDFDILEDKKQTDFFKILDVLQTSLDTTQNNPYVELTENPIVKKARSKN